MHKIRVIRWRSLHTLMSDDPVTPQVILAHMHAMEGRIVHGLRGEMHTMESRLRSDMKTMKIELRQDIDAAAQRVIHQIDAIDARLDAVEIEMPKIKKFVGMTQ